MATREDWESANDTQNVGPSEQITSSASAKTSPHIQFHSNPTKEIIDSNIKETESHDSYLDTYESNHNSPSSRLIPEHRQVIAVSSQKNPGAFFNLARRFLVSDEYVDLSALEGAIVSAVDAAHLLERSKLATIVRIQTSYVAVEPKTRMPGITETYEKGGTYQSDLHHSTSPIGSNRLDPSLIYQTQSYNPQYASRRAASQGKPNNPLRRARISITVRRTENYRIWLEQNQADFDDDDDDEHNGHHEGS